MPKRSGFQSSIQEFLTKSNDEVLGELTKFQEGSVELTKRCMAGSDRRIKQRRVF